MPLPAPSALSTAMTSAAEVAQHLDAHGAQQEVVEADDADAAQEVEHASPAPACSPARPPRRRSSPLPNQAAPKAAAFWSP